MVVLNFLFISSIKINISFEVLESSAPVGSSQSRSFGFLIKALAMAHLCCWPPDSWAGNLFSCSFRSIVFKSSFISKGFWDKYLHTSIFSLTVRLGTRL